jgi:hypothetical protein
MVELIYLFFGWCYFLCSDLNFKDINLGFGQKIYLFLMKLEVEVWRLRSQWGRFGNFGHPLGSFIRSYLWWKWLQIGCFIYWVLNCTLGSKKIITPTVAVSSSCWKSWFLDTSDSSFPGYFAEFSVARVMPVETRAVDRISSLIFYKDVSTLFMSTLCDKH